jgi:hypothetical protein
VANLQKLPVLERRGTLLRACVTIGAFAIGLLYGRYKLASTFPSYDDEGYFLLSLKHYFAGGHLYTEVFSQYGPIYFFIQKILFRLLQLPVNHDAGRLVTLICWLLSAGLAGYFIYRVSKNTILASAAGLASMWLMRVVSEEPGHPQQIILPIFMLACCASVSAGPIGLLLLGGLGAALLFTKINVGIFFFAACALVLVCRFPAGRIRAIGAFFLFAYAAGLPLILMHRDLSQWARGYCLVAIVCGISTFFAGLVTTPPSSKPMRSVLYTVAGAVSVSVIVIAGTMWEGMSLRTLLEGVLWGPLKHPGVFEIPLGVSTGKALFLALVSACIAGLYRFRDHWQAHPDWVNALRCIIGLCVIGLLIADPSSDFFRAALPSVVILLPIGLIPAKNGLWPQSDCVPRLFVASLAATQFLQPYPVAGSQTHIAAVPLLLWAFLCVHDGANGFFRLARLKADWLEQTYSKESILGSVIVCTIPLLMHHHGALHRHSYTVPLSLPGASSLNLSMDEVDTYQVLAKDIQTNCDVLFTMPGMGSFNFWSEVPTPNGFNLTAWMKGLSLDQQQEILQILQGDPKACVIYNADLIGFWKTTPDDLEKLPLARYILYQMPKVSRKQGYEIRVHPQRSSPWIEANPRSSP